MIGIDGATLLIGSVGHPIAQVKFPEIFTGVMARNGVNGVAVPMHVLPGNLEAFLTNSLTIENLIGLSITIPHKPATRRLVRTTDRARRVGSVNFLRRGADNTWEGDITDGIGFVAALHDSGKDIAGLDALVVGCGGVGRAIAFAMAEAGAARVDVSDVDSTRAGDLALGLNEAGTASTSTGPVADGYQLVVNASPVGMRETDPLPIDLGAVGSGSIVADVVVAHQLTPLLEQAQARGAFVQPGRRMTNFQIPLIAAYLGLPGGDWSPATAAGVETSPTH